ncbi:MAG: redoxin family protein [Gemmatimonadota bacterium]
MLRDQVSDSAGLAFLDSLPPAVQENPVILVRRAVDEFYRGMDIHDDSLMDAAQATLARARATDSTNVEAVYLAGAYLADVRKYDDAFPLLQRAANMTTALDVHRMLWQTFQGRRDLTADAKKAAVKADAEALMKARDLPSTSEAVSEIYKDIGLTDEGRAVEDQLLAEHPNTAAAEWVLVNRYRAVSKELYDQKQAGETVDPTKQAEYVRMLRAFIARPEHFQKRLLGDAYRELFQLEVQFLHDDSVVNGDTLYTLVQGMVDYEDINPHIAYGAGAVALADDSTHLEEAERIAREGIAEGTKTIEDQRRFYQKDEDYQHARDFMASIMYDALGWVYLAQGRVQMAEDTLRHAIGLNPKNLTALYHLARLFEHRAGDATDGADVDSAQDYFVRGAMVPTMADNPNDAALKDLYQRRHGSLEGWDVFHADIAKVNRATRRTKVLAGREAHPEPMKDFTLTSLKGNRVDSRRLRGKVAVINFWGTWCGPCVAEMPEFQKFDEKYRNDPDVAVYTIDNDPDPDAVRTWMKNRKFDFPVLLDDGYVSKAGVHGFPTTWFVDRTGHIAFVKQGWSGSLTEEFGWRVEALRNGG